MFHLNAMKKMPIALIYCSIEVLKLSVSSEFVFWNLGLLLFGWFFDNFLFGLFFRTHSIELDCYYN